MSAPLRVDVADLRPGGLLAIESEGLRILVCRAGEAVYAIENRCPHVGIPLDGGCLRGFALECPLHGGRLDVRSGEALEPPIRRPVRTYAVRAVEGGVEIELPGGTEDAPCTT